MVINVTSLPSWHTLSCFILLMPKHDVTIRTKAASARHLTWKVLPRNPCLATRRMALWDEVGRWLWYHLRYETNEPLAKTLYCGLLMRWECRESFRVSDPDMHQCTCVAHVPWCLPGSLTNEAGGGENVPGIPPGACATLNFTLLVTGPYGSDKWEGERMSRRNAPITCAPKIFAKYFNTFG